MPTLNVFVQGGPTIDQRFESYYNYCSLFNYILSKSRLVDCNRSYFSHQSSIVFSVSFVLFYISAAVVS